MYIVQQRTRMDLKSGTREQTASKAINTYMQCIRSFVWFKCLDCFYSQTFICIYLLRQQRFLFSALAWHYLISPSNSCLFDFSFSLCRSSEKVYATVPKVLLTRKFFHRLLWIPKYSYCMYRLKPAAFEANWNGILTWVEPRLRQSGNVIPTQWDHSKSHLMHFSNSASLRPLLLFLYISS